MLVSVWKHAGVFLLLFVSTVESDCERGGTCGDATKALADIRADPKSYQQLLQAFYPVNKAQPAYMVIAYFINFTGTFPEECDGHTYPWTTFPNFTTTQIRWFLWTTIPANNIVNIQLLTEYGLYVPAQSYYYFFNTAPWWLDVTTTTACVALPYNTAPTECDIWCHDILDTVTVEVRHFAYIFTVLDSKLLFVNSCMIAVLYTYIRNTNPTLFGWAILASYIIIEYACSVTVGQYRSTYVYYIYLIHFLPSHFPQLMSVVSPERYWQELVDIHNPGVLEVRLGINEQCYTVNVVRSPVARQQEGMFYWMMGTFGLVVPPSLLYITRRKQLDWLQQVKATKGGPAVMWACIVWMPLANLYFSTKFATSAASFAVKESIHKENQKYMGMIMAYILMFIIIAAVIQSRRFLPVLPYTSMLKSGPFRRVVKFHIWSQFNLLLTYVLAASPYVVLIVGTNPFLYGSALLAIILATSFIILLTAAQITFGQVLLSDPDFRLTCRKARWQAAWLLLVATGCLGVAFFMGCISFLLLLSKGGNKVQSVSGVASFFMSHVVLTALPLLMRSLISYISKYIHIEFD